MRSAEAVVRGPSQNLDSHLQSSLRPSLGFDLSRVRIHADAKAAASAEQLQARAYTLGDHVVFGPNEYRPHTSAGRLLLAHELAHVAQQKRSSGASSPGLPKPELPGPPLKLGNPAHPAEREAEAFAAAALSGHPPSLPHISAHESSGPVLRRAPKAAAKQSGSWAGVFQPMDYKTIPVEDDHGLIHCGANIRIAFKPNDKVNADQIAFSQTAQITLAGQPASIYFNDDHNEDIATADSVAEPALRGIANRNADTSLTASNRTGKGQKIRNVEESRKISVMEPAAGTGIDNLPQNRTPIANMKDPPKGGDLSNPVLVGGILGSHSLEKGAPKHQDAEMHDNPKFSFPKNVDAENTFESTALAVSGVQKGAYYGSVQWGWRKKASDAQPTLLPFTLIEKSTPSPVFAEAVTLWNASSDLDGEASIPLPVVGKKYLTAKNPATLQLLDKPENGKNLASLHTNTLVEMTDQTDTAHKDWKRIIVIEGPSTGKAGWIRQDTLSDRPAPKSK